MEPNCSPPTLESLPIEILLQLSTFLTPQSILRLSATSKYLNEIYTSQAVWRGISGAVYELADEENAVHLQEGVSGARSELQEGQRGEPEDLSGRELAKAKFLVSNARYIGWFLSSVPYSSRIIRISLSPSSADSAPCLLATQFTATNVPSSTPQIPTGALLHPNRSSYDVPIEGPGSNVPLAGYLVDLLNPQYNLHPLFRIDQEEGALLSTGRHSSFETGTGRLKLRLVDVEREVDSKEEGREDEGRERQNRNFFNLFNGVLPRRSWPTPLLVHGGEEVGRGKGAVRGMMDWVTERGVRNLTEPVTVQEQGEADKIRVKGFRLQVKKMITSLPGAFPRPGPSNPLPPRRRGVGPNGGPAILFDGEERDPELDLPMRRDVAALRAGAGLGVGNREGGENQQSLVLNVPVEEEEDLGAEIRRSDDEEWFPISAPSRPLSFSSPPTCNSTGEILASSLEGLWVGTYGPHGLEFGSLSVHCIPIPEDSALGDVPIRLSPPPSPSATRTPRRYTVELRFLKLTGDQNVPCGQYSWIASLPSLDLEDVNEGVKVVTVPTVTNEELIRWSSYDPALATTSNQPLPQWEKGSVEGKGQIAGAGFSSRSWTGARVTFIQSEVEVQSEILAGEVGEERRETRTTGVVEEIRLTWPAMGMCSNFRRVRFES